LSACFRMRSTCSAAKAGACSRPGRCARGRCPTAGLEDELGARVPAAKRSCRRAGAARQRGGAAHLLRGQARQVVCGHAVHVQAVSQQRLCARALPVRISKPAAAGRRRRRGPLWASGGCAEPWLWAAGLHRLAGCSGERAGQHLQGVAGNPPPCKDEGVLRQEAEADAWHPAACAALPLPLALAGCRPAGLRQVTAARLVVVHHQHRLPAERAVCRAAGQHRRAGRQACGGRAAGSGRALCRQLRARALCALAAVRPGRRRAAQATHLGRAAPTPAAACCPACSRQSAPAAARCSAPPPPAAAPAAAPAATRPGQSTACASCSSGRRRRRWFAGRGHSSAGRRRQERREGARRPPPPHLWISSLRGVWSGRVSNATMTLGSRCGAVCSMSVSLSRWAGKPCWVRGVPRGERGGVAPREAGCSAYGRRLGIREEGQGQRREGGRGSCAARRCRDPAGREGSWCESCRQRRPSRATAAAWRSSDRGPTCGAALCSAAPSLTPKRAAFGKARDVGEAEAGCWSVAQIAPLAERAPPKPRAHPWAGRATRGRARPAPLSPGC
jgi:hypothetical protein